MASKFFSAYASFAFTPLFRKIFAPFSTQWWWTRTEAWGANKYMNLLGFIATEKSKRREIQLKRKFVLMVLENPKDDIQLERIL